MFDYFCQFKALVEKKSAHYIKSLRAYRDGEYVSINFWVFFKEHGIQKQLKTRYTPQQNGIGERKNRTIM